jgi:predicted MFS family arabinose efflux permease
MSAIFVAAYNCQVLVPLLAFRVLGGSSGLYGVLMSCLGLGAVTGSLLIASRAKSGVAMVAAISMLLGAVHVWLALPLGLYSAFAGVFVLGLCCGFFNVTVAGTLQLRARDDVRGRVMATYSIAILGSGLVGVLSTYLVIAAVCVGTATVTAKFGSRPERPKSIEDDLPKS